MKQFIFSAVVLSSLLFSASAQAQTYVDVNGMVCEFCAQSLNEVFGREENVDKLDINLDTKIVTIYYKDNSEPLSDEVINKFVYEAGYDVTGIRQEGEVAP